MGKTLREVADIRGTDAVQALLDLVEWVEREQGDESIIATSMVEEDIKKIMQWGHKNELEKQSLSQQSLFLEMFFPSLQRWGVDSHVKKENKF